jgi:putative protease
MCKFTTLPDVDIEILTPKDADIKECESEIGEIFFKESKAFIRFKKIVTSEGKELESVHSGYLHPIKLPCKLPAWTILRQKIKED